MVDYLSSQPNRAGYQVSTKQGSGPELRSGARWGGQAMIEGRGNSRSEARKLERRPPWGGCGLVALLRGVFVIAVVAVFNAALFFTFFY